MPPTPTEPSDAEPTEHTETEAAEPIVNMPTDPIEEPIESTSIQQSSSANNRPQSRPKKKADSIVNDVLMFKRPAIREDRYDIFGKSVSIKMRELSKNQRIIAEKIINDTLFEGELGNLTLSHKLCNDNHTQKFTLGQQPQPKPQYSHSPIAWSTSSNCTYSSSSPVPPVPATNSRPAIVITQQPLEIEEQQRSNSVQLSIPD